MLRVPAPDFEDFLTAIRGPKAPKRVHCIELFLDPEVQDAVADRSGILDSDPFARQIAIQRCLGYDYVRCGVDPFPMPMAKHTAADTAAMGRSAGRSFVDNVSGPIATWEQFHAYPWPGPAALTTRALEWYQKHLPDDMCLIGSGGYAHIAEHMTWLMGYETLCFALYEQRDLVQAIVAKLRELNLAMTRLMLQFSRVKLLWGADDMGFRTGTLISPADLRELVLPVHAELAAMAHAAGRPYLLHSCGKLDDILPDLIHAVRIDGKHSFEDTIGTIEHFHARYGTQTAALGGVDVDLLCRSDAAAIRRRVRRIVETCQPRGRFCLGTGNSVANYIPLDNYLAMLDETYRA